VEDILRDAACFAAHDEVPTGLAHRALAREIALQTRQEFRPSRPDRKRTMAIWLGGLSAGTVAGASAAVLVLAHLNGNAFQIAPEVVLSEPTVPETPGALSGYAALPPAVREQPLPRPRKTAVKPAAVTSIAMTSMQMPSAKYRASAPQIAEPKVQPRPIRVARVKEQQPIKTARLPRVTPRISSPSGERAAGASSHWKTETFEETEYQLVTTAYVPSPGSGSYPIRNDHIQLTPVRMRTGPEPTGTDSLAGSTMTHVASFEGRTIPL
jgi:hypothetical protein